MHGTTVLPKEGVTLNLSQNLAKRTVTAIQKWQQGTEETRHFNYRLNQLGQDLLAQEALLKSIKKNKEKKEKEVMLEGDNVYTGNYIDINITDREWHNN